MQSEIKMLSFESLNAVWPTQDVEWPTPDLNWPTPD